VMRKMILDEEKVRRQRVKMTDDEMLFDPTIERGCDAFECNATAEWRPVLLLQPGRDYCGKPMRLPLGIVVCAQHKLIKAEDYLNEELWSGIVAEFKSKGIVHPHRASTRLDFDRQGLQS